MGELDWLTVGLFALRWLCATVGAFVLYIIVVRKGEHPFSILQALEKRSGRVPARRSKGLVFADMLGSSALGAFVLVAGLQPCSLSDAGLYV
jgi:hypothetical protein